MRDCNPVAQKSRMPLNNCSPGGGSNAAQAKLREQALLGALTEVLDKVLKKPTKPDATQHVDSLLPLLGALQRLLEGAHKNPVGLLDRLANLVKIAREGRLEALGIGIPLIT